MSWIYSPECLCSLAQADSTSPQSPKESEPSVASSGTLRNLNDPLPRRSRLGLLRLPH